MNYNWKNRSDDEIVKIVLERQVWMEKTRKVYEDLHSAIISVFRPRRIDMLTNTDYEKGQRFGRRVYDQTPANALSKFSNGKVGYLVNRAVPWIQYITPDAKYMEIDRVKDYLNRFAEQVLYAAGRSNLYSSLPPSSMDADSVGTSVILPLRDEVNDRTIFDVVHPSDSYIANDRFGFANVYHRQLKLTRMNAEEMFGKEKSPKTWYDEKGVMKQFLAEDEYIWAVYPNGDRDNTSKLPVDMPYITFCIALKRQSNGTYAAKNSKLVYKSGKEYFPIVYRTGRESGALYGTSIAADCLTSALMANKLGEKTIMAAHKAVEPPVVVSRSIGANLRQNPGGVTEVDDINREGAKPWLDRLNWPISDAQMERIHDQINDKMFIRFFEMLSSGDIKNRTAYEVSQMMAEKATLMSTIVDNFEHEVLEPALQILINQEEQAGRMPDPPPEIYEIGGMVDTRFLGPLEQLQRSLLRSRGTIDALGLIGQMMQLNEQVGWVFDWDSMAEDIAIAQGMPQKHILSEAAKDQLKQQIQMQNEQMQQMQMLESAGKAAPGLGKAPEEGSPAEALLAQQGAAA